VGSGPSGWYAYVARCSMTAVGYVGLFSEETKATEVADDFVSGRDKNNQGGIYDCIL
jgi:hypothetical protein